MFKKILLLLIFSCFVIFSATGTPTAQAQESDPYGIETTRENAGLDKTSDSPQVIIGRAVNTLFGLVGAIFLIMILASGLLWMTAGGSEEKVAKAKKLASNAITGMFIMFLSYALIFVILFALRAASGT